jgi:hypothetical protein
LFQFIEFASGDNVEADDVKLPNPLPGIATVRLGGSLEALFAQKNKKLQEENARLRVRVAPAHTHLALTMIAFLGFPPRVPHKK